MKLTNRHKIIGGVLGALLAVTSLVALSPKTITCTGTAANPQNYDLGGAEFSSLVIKGSYCKVHNFTVRGSVSHGVRVGEWVYAPSITHHVEVYDFAIYDSTTEGLDGGSWGSCLKAETNSHDLYFHDGIIARCGGEAVGITGAEHVLIERVDVTDGKMAGFYVDNSFDVKILDTSVTCTGDSYYYRNGKPSAAYLFGDEDYAQTLHASKLGSIVVKGAESFRCSAMSYWGGYVSPNGINGLLFEGVFWDCPNYHYIKPAPRNANLDTDGIEYKPSTTITPTPTLAVTPSQTKTAAPTGTKTATPIPSVTRTPSLIPSATRTPVITATPVCYPVYVGDKYIGIFCP